MIDGSTRRNKIESPDIEESTDEEANVDATVADKVVDKVSTINNNYDKEKANKESMLI